MMLKRIAATFRATSNASFLTTGSSHLASKVMRRALSDYKVAKEWDLYSAVCLERHPVVTKPMQDVETRYQNVLRQIERENSLMSDFEIRRKTEKGLKNTSTDQENAITNQTTQDFLDAAEEELSKFKFAPRISDDNGVESLKRKLDRHLVLLVKQKVADAETWLPPWGMRKHGETMIQTARRSMQELCGDDMQVQFYGNAPIGFYKYKYSKGVRGERTGAKVFFFLAKYLNGDVCSDVKHCWLDRQELQDTLNPNLHKSLSRFMLPD